MPPFTILVDSREQKPFLFPAHIAVPSGNSSRTIPITTHTLALETGDYATPGCGVVIERKGSIGEIASNLLSHDRTRQLQAFDRLAAFPRPYLALEGSPSLLLTPSRRTPEPWKALSILLPELLSRSISLLLLPTTTYRDRMAAGELIARILYAGVHTCPYPFPLPKPSAPSSANAPSTA